MRTNISFCSNLFLVEEVDNVVVSGTLFNNLRKKWKKSVLESRADDNAKSHVYGWIISILDDDSMQAIYCPGTSAEDDLKRVVVSVDNMSFWIHD